jgi:hypothetical protein
MPGGHTAYFRRAHSSALPLLVFAPAGACCWPALPGGQLWDDPAHLTRPGLRSWAGLGHVGTVGVTQEYYPVLFSAFWLEHRLWGDSLPACRSIRTSSPALHFRLWPRPTKFGCGQS